MLEPRIQQHFFESADLLYQVAENLSRPIADAAQMAVGALTAGGKLLTGGSGGGQVLARLMSAALMSRLERERPPLAAVSLGHEPAGLRYVLAPDVAVSAADDLALPLMALGQPGDVLVLFCLHGHDPAAEAAIAEAHAKDMSVVLFGAGLSAPWHALLAETDVWIAVPHERAMRAMELQMLALHALCDAIDVQLMGDADATG